MKKIIHYITIGSFLFLMNAGCNKSVKGRTDNLAPLNPQNIDLNAGTWKTVLLTRPDTFAVTAPAANNSTAYLSLIHI